MFLFAPFLKLKPFQFFLAAISIVCIIPLSLILIVLVPFLVQTLNGTPADVLWETLLGAQLSHLIAPIVAGTQFETGITLSFQKQYLAQIVIIIAFLFAMFSFVSDYLLNAYGERIAKHLRTQVAQKFLSLNFQSALRCDAGLLASLVGPFTNEAKQTFVRLTTSVLKDGLIAVVFTAWLLLLNSQLFILLILIAIPAMIILIKTSRVLKRLAKQGTQIHSELVGDILERMRGWQTIQMYKAIPFEIDRLQTLNQKMFHTWRRSARAKALGSPLVEWFAIVAGAIIAIIALRRVYSGEVSTPILVSFVVTIGILGETIRRMINQANSSRQGIESLRRITTFLNTDLPKREIVNFDVSHPQNENLKTVEISNLSISNLDQTLLVEKLNGVFKSGEFVLLIGPSGIGKTTFLNVLLGLLKSSEGHILFNQSQANELVYLQYASQIGFIPQDPHVFEGSIFENLTYPQKIIHPTQEQILLAQNALSSANLNKDLNSNVFGLSGGEKQRLMFARILYNKPSLIVIDEGTSALDSQNENNILQTLKTALDSSIIFMVSHRANVKNFATHIIDFSKYKNFV